VDPGRALRMILLGPGGATTLDAWVTPEAYRFEVPPIGLLRRGGASGDASLPVDFFRQWFLAPFEGRLLASHRGNGAVSRETQPCVGRWYILRWEEGTTTVCDEDVPGRLEGFAERWTPRSVEHLTFRGRGLTPSAGDRAEYRDPRSHVTATVEVESVDEAPPDPVAFLDPENGGAR
jgi:hypothetical protein